MINTNRTIEETVKDTSYEDDRGNLVRQSETTVVYKADLFKVDQPTASGRIYPRAVMERALAAYRETIDANRAFGTMEPGPEPHISLRDVSHVVTRVELCDDVLRAEVKIVQTEAGKRLAGLLKHSVLDLLPTGYGSERDGRVGDDYIIRSFDFMATPPKEPSK